MEYHFCLLLKMGELTSTVRDDKIIAHFRKVMAPYVIDTQLSSLGNDISPNVAGYSVHSRTPLHNSGTEFMDEYTRDLRNGLQGLSKEKVRALKRMFKTDRRKVKVLANIVEFLARAGQRAQAGKEQDYSRKKPLRIPKNGKVLCKLRRK